MVDIGNKIRKSRLRRKFTLDYLSRRTGLSKSFLSQVERNLTQASVTSLKKIAHELGIGVVYFFTDDEINHDLWGYDRSYPKEAKEAFNYSKDIKVVRAGRRKGFTLPGCNVVYEILTPDLNRQLEVMYMRISKGETSGDEPMVDAPGEKFGVVLKGTLEFCVGTEVFQLSAGDAIVHPADVPHTWRGLEGESIEVIWAQTPPSL